MNTAAKQHLQWWVGGLTVVALVIGATYFLVRNQQRLASDAAAEDAAAIQVSSPASQETVPASITAAADIRQAEAALDADADLDLGSLDSDIASLE